MKPDAEDRPNRCAEHYNGPSFPNLAGMRCVLDGPHTGLRHQAVHEGTPLSWYTPEEKRWRAHKQKPAKEPHVCAWGNTQVRPVDLGDHGDKTGEFSIDVSCDCGAMRHYRFSGKLVSWFIPHAE